jgi:hypothetical protein
MNSCVELGEVEQAHIHLSRLIILYVPVASLETQAQMHAQVTFGTCMSAAPDIIHVYP